MNENFFKKNFVIQTHVKKKKIKLAYYIFTYCPFHLKSQKLNDRACAKNEKKKKKKKKRTIYT
ncbi:hypothetical protein PFTANZ_04995 [Plasmodium falciparum Tanzania (2000708)]|uniref:Uncharacterized protein n=1 Tax=Plasmodium falciparum Tanzania (2000708) TaxID=1036725 RepID=A0A024W1B1_PLAFA|nr:hypothetical protein PFTANZ_04995 [Plasmodium falciparum Tanzania (2000708)]